MERDKAEIYVWQITDLHNNIGDEYGAVDLLNEYANKRVIEELENAFKVEHTQSTVSMYENLKARLTQLKQE